MKTTTKISPKEVAQRIDNSASRRTTGRNSVDYILELDAPTDFPSMVEVGEEFGRALDEALRFLGWQRYVVGHYCSKATFEAHLTKPGTGVKIEIISSFFLGPFTQISNNPTPYLGD